MDSPIRQYLKQKDYLRHKLFRKLKRRRAAERQLKIDAPIREMKRRIRLKRFKDGKDDDYYYQTINKETGDIYNVHPSALNANELEVTLPEIKVTAPRKYEYRSAYHPEDVENAFNMTGIGMLFNPFRLARTTGLLLEKPSFNNAVEVAHDVLPWSKPGRFLLGAYNLANKEGLEKTYNLTKTGLYNGAILSGIGDIFNTAMMVEGGLGTASNLGINSITDVKDLLASPYYKYMVNKAAKNSPLSYRLKRLNMSERELQGLLQDPVEYFNQLDAAGLRDPFSPFGLLGVEKIIHEHPEILKEVLNSDKTFKGWSEINVRKLFDEHDILLGRNPDVLNLLTALEDTGIGRDAVENAALNYIRNNRGGVTKSLYDDLYNQWRAGQDITKSMYDPDANKILAFDYYDKVGDKTKDAAKKTLDEIVVGHEAGHSRNRSSFGLPGDFQFNDEFYSLSPLVQKYFLSHRNDEVLLRLGQLYDWYGLTDYKKMSPGMLRFAAKKYTDSPTGLNNNMNDFFKYVPLNRSTLDWAINSGMLFNSGKDPGIHINPKNRSKFNALKKRTGKTTELLTHSKNPLTRKRAIFSQNARKWHHK